MLREIPDIRQIKGEPHRRWFTSLSAELMVWSEQDVMTGFQLSYDKSRVEKVITWQQGEVGLQHSLVDDGEHRPGKPKATPVLVTDEAFDG